MSENARLREKANSAITLATSTAVYLQEIIDSDAEPYTKAAGFRQLATETRQSAEMMRQA